MAVGPRRLIVETVELPDPSDRADPDFVDQSEAGALAGLCLTDCFSLWRRLAPVPYAVAGRLAALAQPVRPSRVDLLVPEASVPAATAALSRLSMPRWHERLQMYTGND
ncbi:hypothetical protein [Actinoplanes rectilineatus]|uniref:hypothetical protein n=1 Tax=Actinoplanes rectilineatus TaxID=113571 RepID=UPI000AD0DE5A|nr:hypothetical protein [Actinoplanes rectilineatus]